MHSSSSSLTQPPSMTLIISARMSAGAWRCSPLRTDSRIRSSAPKRASSRPGLSPLNRSTIFWNQAGRCGRSRRPAVCTAATTFCTAVLMRSQLSSPLKIFHTQ